MNNPQDSTLKRVLVVDDNPVSRELVREVLETSNLRVLEASNGKEALDAIARDSPDVVLMDIQMPVLDGYEFMHALRQIPHLSSLPVIALTAMAMQEDREKAHRLGFADYITKPINAGELRNKIQILLSRL